MRDKTENVPIDSTQELFQQYASQFSSILDQHAIIFSLDLAGNNIYANAKYSEISGYEPQELIANIGHMLPMGIHANDSCPEMWETISCGRTWKGIIQDKKKGGEAYWLKSTVSPLKGEDNIIKGYILIGTDITDLELSRIEHDKSLRALKALSAVNRLLTHSEVEKQLLIDLCNALVQSAKYRLACIGYKRRDSGETFDLVASSGFDEEYSQKITFHGICGEQDDSLQVVNDVLADPVCIQWRDAALRHGCRSIIALPLKDDNNDSYGVLLCYAVEPNDFGVREIEIMGEVAEDLSFGLRHLRTMNDKRRIERQLRQAQKMEAIGQLTSGIAHDFNNILVGIMGYTDLAINKLEPEQEKLHRFLSEVYQAGERARDLISQMLLFTRTDSLTDLDDNTIEVVTASNSILKIVHGSLPSSMEIHVQKPPDNKPLFCYMDLVSLQKVLTNLLINARDAANGEGEVIVNLYPKTIHSAQCDSCRESFSGEYAVIEIITQGAGIDEGLLNSSSDSLFTTNESSKDSGLGLVTVYRLVHQAIGHIKVSSGPQQGARVSVYLRRAEETIVSPEENIKKINNGDIFNGLRVMVVDDEASLAGFLEYLLSMWGMEVISFVSSEEAWQHMEAESERFDLIITDQTMTKITGLELAQRIQRLQPDVAILVTSGYSDKINSEIAAQKNIGFIRKPFTPHELQDTLIAILR